MVPYFLNNISMSKRQLLCVLGAWVIVLLFLGFPSMWNRVIAIVTGLIIITIAYNLPPDQTKNDTKETFVENKNN